MEARSSLLISRKRNKAQSVLEYIIILILLASALITIGVYFKRSVQGKYRAAGDAIGGGDQ